MRRLLKFLHTIGAVGLMGASATMIVLLESAPAPAVSLAGYASIREALGAIARWIFLPSMTLTLIAGLLAIAANRRLHNAGWAWVKAATGILVFEAGFVGVQGPMVQEAARSLSALAGQLEPAALAGSLAAERNTLWLMLAVSAANVALGVWRPRLTRLPD